MAASIPTEVSNTDHNGNKLPAKFLLPEALKEEKRLQEQLIITDQLDFTWDTPPNLDNPKSYVQGSSLKYVCGMDVSFFKDDDTKACACLVVLQYPPGKKGDMKIVYQDCQIVPITFPYVSGYLAHREAPMLIPLWEKLKQTKPEFLPQLLFVDGNGLLHPRNFGLACYLGVSLNVPTIGVTKKLSVAGSHTSREEALAQIAQMKQSREPVKFFSKGVELGCAMLSPNTTNPIFVSPGHRISPDTAYGLTIAVCTHRIPEPIRMADMISRQYILDLQKATLPVPVVAVDASSASSVSSPPVKRQEKTTGAAIKMYLVVNQDLLKAMGIGKTGGQCGHAAAAITRLMERQDPKYCTPELRSAYYAWLASGEAKIVVKTPEENLKQLRNKYPNLCYAVYDEGKTRINSNSFTVLGFVPMHRERIPTDLSSLPLV
jgi:deoxyinosine 3'endonuclease (endonuclease V)/peptidyl-tRNA hydrolase